LNIESIKIKYAIIKYAIIKYAIIKYAIITGFDGRPFVIGEPDIFVFLFGNSKNKANDLASCTGIEVGQLVVDHG